MIKEMDSTYHPQHESQEETRQLLFYPIFSASHAAAARLDQRQVALPHEPHFGYVRGEDGSWQYTVVSGSNRKTRKRRRVGKCE